MAGSLLEDMFLPMLLPLDFSFEKVAVRNVLPRLWTHLVRTKFDFLESLNILFIAFLILHNLANPLLQTARSAKQHTSLPVEALMTQTRLDGVFRSIFPTLRDGLRQTPTNIMNLYILLSAYLFRKEENLIACYQC